MSGSKFQTKVFSTSYVVLPAFFFWITKDYFWAVNSDNYPKPHCKDQLDRFAQVSLLSIVNAWFMGIILKDKWDDIQEHYRMYFSVFINFTFWVGVLRFLAISSGYQSDLTWLWLFMNYQCYYFAALFCFVYKRGYFAHKDILLTLTFVGFGQYYMFSQDKGFQNGCCFGSCACIFVGFWLLFGYGKQNVNAWTWAVMVMFCEAVVRGLVFNFDTAFFNYLPAFVWLQLFQSATATFWFRYCLSFCLPENRPKEE